MTISSTTRKAGPFFGNDATIDFPFTFKVFKKQDVRVTLTDPTGADQVLLLDSSYGVTLNTDQDSNPGGTVRYPVLGSPLPATWRLTVTGGLPNTQPTDIQNNGGFYPQIVEDMGDRSTIQIQQLQEQIDRSLKFSVSDSGAGTVLPPADQRANKMLGFDAAGIPTTLIPASGSAAEVALALASFINSLANSSDTVQGSALVGGVSRIVSTIAELRNQRGDKNPYVTAIGYYARGDKSPAFYFYDPTDGVSADNGGTVIVTQFGHRYKLNHRGFVSIDDFGARGNGVADDSMRIQAAFDWANVSKVPLTASARTYGLALSQRIAMEGWNQTYCALIYKTGVKIRGQGAGATVFKLLDNQSTDASPKFFNLMASNQVLDHIEIQGITFDLNGQNNKISPDRGSGVYAAFNTAALMVSGSVTTTGTDARVNNSRIMFNEFINIPGVTGLALGQRYGHPGVKGSNNEIAFNRFYNNGIDSSDHSSIYGFSNDSRVHHNFFDHPTPSTGRGGPVACVECFGSNISVHDNFARNYLQFAWVGAGEEGEHRGIAIYNNRALVSLRAVGTWSTAVQNDGIADLAIYDNDFEMLAAPIAISGIPRVAFDLVMHDCNLIGVSVYGNRVICRDRTDNTGMVLLATTGRSIGPVHVWGNEFRGFSRGIGVGVEGSGSILGLSAWNNAFLDMEPTTARPTDTICIEISGLIYELFLTDNNGLGSDLYPGSTPKYGITLAGNIGRLHMEGNGLRASQNDILMNAVVSGRRTGRQALTFAAMPLESTWKIGDTTYLQPAPLLGVTPNQYIMDGWQRMTDGTANVLGVDWRERRLLVGP